MPGLGDDVPLSLQLATLRARSRSAALVGFPVAALLAGFFLTSPATYDASSVLSFRPNDAAAINDQAVRLLLSRYTAVGQSRPALEAAGRATGTDDDVLRDAVTVLNPPETANVRVSAALTEPRRAAAVADSIASTILATAAADGLLTATQIERADPSTSPSGAGRALKLAVALLVGLLAAIIAALVSEALRPRLRTRGQLRRLTAATAPVWLDPAGSDAAQAAALRAVVTSRATVGPAAAPRLVLVLSASRPVAPFGPGQPLAASLAEQDGLVLHVEADPDGAPGQRLGTDEAALHELVASGAPLAKALEAHRGSVTTLTVRDLPSSVVTRSLHRDLRSRAGDFDHVVIEAGPLLRDEVALMVAPSCDVVVLVVSAGDRVDQTQEALDLCRDLRLPDVVVCGVGFPGTS